MQEPVQIRLGTRCTRRGHGRKRRSTQVKESMIYVPLLKTLEVLLMDEGIYTEVTCVQMNMHVHTF